MNKNKVKSSTKVIVFVTFLVMIIVNALANILPINGKGTGQVSDSYPNLFAPAGITFAIWGLIYLLLAGFTLYLLGFFQRGKHRGNQEFLNQIELLFSLSSIANASWIFAWHYDRIRLSVFLMIIILACLIIINQMIKKENLTTKEKLFIRLPFSVYFGWITVATIANITTLLVALNWKGFGIPEVTWTIIILLVGMLIGVATILINKDIAYGLVLIWAYLGILIKHKSLNGFSGQYPTIITTVMICIILFIVAEMIILLSNKRRKTSR